MRKRRQFTPEFKAMVVLDVLTGVLSQAEECRKHGLGPNTPGTVGKTALSSRRPHLIFTATLLVAPRRSRLRIAELEQVLGRMTLENEILKRLFPQNLWVQKRAMGSAPARQEVFSPPPLLRPSKLRAKRR